jgi:RHS repeat-associated protein
MMNQPEVILCEVKDDETREVITYLFNREGNHVGDCRHSLQPIGDLLAVDHIEYDGYGNLEPCVEQQESSVSSDRFRDVARECDGEDALQRNLIRSYDPTIGRWMSDEPIAFAGSDPNLYRYVANSKDRE